MESFLVLVGILEGCLALACSLYNDSDNRDCMVCFSTTLSLYLLIFIQMGIYPGTFMAVGWDVRHGVFLGSLMGVFPWSVQWIFIPMAWSDFSSSMHESIAIFILYKYTIILNVKYRIIQVRNEFGLEFVLN